MSKELSDIGQKLPVPLPPQVEKQLGGAIEQAKAARITQEQAEDARRRVNEATDPADRQKLEDEVKRLEKDARKKVKMAQRLESGVWQGAGAGIGIGAATGMGVGTVVGLVLGAVTAVPTTILGGLVGTGTGAIHGPWFKLGAEEGVSQGLAEAQDQLDSAQEKIASGDLDDALQKKIASGEKNVEDTLQARIAEAQSYGAQIQTQLADAQKSGANLPIDDLSDLSEEEPSTEKGVGATVVPNNNPQNTETQKSEPAALTVTDQKPSGSADLKKENVSETKVEKKKRDKKGEGVDVKAAALPRSYPHDPLDALDTAEDAYSSFAPTIPLPTKPSDLKGDDSQQYKDFAMQGLGVVGKAFTRSSKSNKDAKKSQEVDNMGDNNPSNTRSEPKK